MKVIDEKGRLFGKVNIVDLLVLVLIVAAAAVLGMKLLGGRAMPGEQSKKLTYTVRVMEVTQETYESVCRYVDRQAGIKDQLQASGKLLPGYIVDVTATPHVPISTDTVGGQTLDLLFTVEATVTNLVKNEVGTQEVRIGKSHILKGQHIEFEKGTIMTCRWDDIDS